MYGVCVLAGLLVGYVLRGRRDARRLEEPVEADGGGGDPRVEELEAEVTSLLNHVDALQTELQSAESERHASDALSSDEARTVEEIRQDAEAEVGLAAEQVAAAQDRISALEKELKETRAELERSRGAVMPRQGKRRAVKSLWPDGGPRRTLMGPGSGALLGGGDAPVGAEETSLQQQLIRTKKSLVAARKERDAAKAEARGLREKLDTSTGRGPADGSADATRKARRGAKTRPPAGAVAAASAAPKTTEEVAPESADRESSWLLSAPVGEADDLKAIRGIGPVMSESLNAIGVWHFRQLAAMTSEDVAWLASRVNTSERRIEKADWVAQATRLHHAKYGTAP